VNRPPAVKVSTARATWESPASDTRGSASMVRQGAPPTVPPGCSAKVERVASASKGMRAASVSRAWLATASPARGRIFGQGNPAGHFNGNVIVTGTLDVGVDIRLVNADCAEEFDVEFGPIEPGVVVVLSDGGRLLASSVAYDKRVAGVVSGAGGYRPGLTLDAQHATAERVPVALMGKVYCRVDAESAPIEIGDMLTTATTPGHAMKARDATRAFGAVIGKALGSLTTGRGLIPILVTLQ
jgi:hypothetical protein